MLALLLLLFAIDPASPAWYVHYEKGLALIQDGSANEARVELEAALKERSVEGLQLAIGDRQYVDYLPHLYLAIASQMGGDVAAARKHLAAASNSGVAPKSEVGKPLFVAYELLLRGEISKPSPRPRYATYEPKPTILSDEEFRKLQGEVLSECQLPPDIDLADAPWYVPYELALKLERKGDPQRAVDLFVEAVKRRPNPQTKARTYGMWLIDYYPYFHIARAHAKLENWECAANALEISERLSELPAKANEYNEFQVLKQRAELKRP